MSTIFKEASDSYEAMKKTLSHVMGLKEEILEKFKSNQVKKIFLTGCGTSFYQLRTFESLLALNTDIRTLVVPSGDALLNFDRYKSYLNDALVVTVSRTGYKGEPVELFKLVKEQTNAKIFGIISSDKSTIKELADYVIELPWSYDHWVNQTRSIINHAAAYMAIISFITGRDDIMGNLNKIAEKGTGFIGSILPLCERIGKLGIENAMVLSDSESCGLSEVGALMFDEIPCVNAQYRHIMDALHGPQCSLKKNSLVIALLNEQTTEKQTNIINKLQERTKHVIVFRGKEPSGITGLMDEVFFGEKLLPETIGLPFLTLVTFITYYIGIDLCLISDIEQEDYRVGHIYGTAY